MKLKLKFKLSYYNSDLPALTVGADVGESVLPKIGPMFVCELPTRSSYVVEVLLLRSKLSICSSFAR